MKSKKLPWFRFYWLDYMASMTVRAMAPLEELAYLRMLIASAETGGRLSADPKQLARIARCTPKQVEKYLAEGALGEAWQREGNELVNRRMAEALAHNDALSERRSEAGKRGNQARWGSHCEADATASDRNASQSDRKRSQTVATPSQTIANDRDQSRSDQSRSDSPPYSPPPPLPAPAAAVQAPTTTDPDPALAPLPEPQAPAPQQPAAPSEPPPEPLPQAVLDLAPRLAVLGLRATHEAERLLRWFAGWAPHPASVWVEALERWAAKAARGSWEGSPIQACRKCILGRRASAERGGHVLGAEDLAAWIQADADAIAAERAAAAPAPRPQAPQGPSESPIARLRRERQAARAAEAPAASLAASEPSPMASRSISAPVAS